MCGDCCYGEGGILIEENEMKNIPYFLWISPHEFSARFCEKRNSRLYLKTGSNNFCIFYDRDRGCLIHFAKPRRCSSWPFYPAIVNDKETWEMAKDACPGMNQSCSFEEFVRQAMRVENGPS